MFLSTMETLTVEGHNVAYQCKGLDQSNLVCEYCNEFVRNLLVRYISTLLMNLFAVTVRSLLKLAL